MKILALEFSSSQRSVAVVQPGQGPGPIFQSEIIEAGGGATDAFRMIERALTEARLQRDDIECLALGLGPGSYNGIRVAIALAQGWQLARPVRLLGLRTVDVLAAQTQAEGTRGRIHIVVDAQRGEFYLSGWEISADQRVEAEPLHITTREEVERRLASGSPMLGPDLRRWLPAASELHPSARVLGRLALARTDFVSGDQLQPVYLRQTSFVKAPPPRQV